MTAFIWTKKNTDEAKRLYIVEGLSSSQIAVAIGATSRNAVIGRLHRLGVKRGSAAGPTVRKPKMNVVTRLKVSAPKAKGRGVSDASVIALYAPIWHANASTPRGPTREVFPDPDDLLTARPWETRAKGECAWPFGPSDATLSCCKPVARDAYCEKHIAMGFTASPYTAKSDERLAKWMSRVA